MDKKLRLLYRGSRDGFRTKDVAAKIDNKGPTLVLVKSDDYNVFGGYTPISWKRGQKEYKKMNGTSFIFSVRNNGEIHKFDAILGAYEVFFGSAFNQTLCFCDGFAIMDKCNITN